MSETPTRREILDRSTVRIRQMGDLAWEIHRAWWRPVRNRRLRREIRQLAAQGNEEYAKYWVRNGKGRLVFRAPAGD